MREMDFSELDNKDTDIIDIKDAIKTIAEIMEARGSILNTIAEVLKDLSERVIALEGSKK